MESLYSLQREQMKLGMSIVALCMYNKPQLSTWLELETSSNSNSNDKSIEISNPRV